MNLAYAMPLKMNSAVESDFNKTTSIIEYNAAKSINHNAGNDNYYAQNTSLYGTYYITDFMYRQKQANTRSIFTTFFKFGMILTQFLNRYYC
jgi:hypothetical protein